MSVSAGDIATFSADFIGTTWSAASGTASPISYGTDCDEILSWKDCGIATLDNLSAFKITLSNNITPFYKLGSGVYPTVLIEGVRTVTGSYSFYGPPGDQVLPVTGAIFNFGTTSITLDKVITTAEVPAASPGLTVTTVNFTGVCEWASA